MTLHLVILCDRQNKQLVTFIFISKFRIWKVKFPLSGWQSNIFSVYYIPFLDKYAKSLILCSKVLVWYFFFDSYLVCSIKVDFSTRFFIPILKNLIAQSSKQGDYSILLTFYKELLKCFSHLRFNIWCANRTNTAHFIANCGNVWKGTTCKARQICWCHFETCLNLHQFLIMDML